MSDDKYLEVYRREAYTYKAAYEDSLQRIAALEAEVEALKHDLEKSMANHVADINGFESQREVSK